MISTGACAGAGGFGETRTVGGGASICADLDLVVSFEVKVLFAEELAFTTICGGCWHAESTNSVNAVNVKREEIGTKAFIFIGAQLQKLSRGFPA